MASKLSNAHPAGRSHTAGIFADMSIDGPEIGTLVAVIDKAKNLPNRKTIGKQDPYCAARLGKEAKKTSTDIRGGQTPKWDQELRFKVHDSADYYQLKISVFTDDKRTDLIGEAWIDLKGIVVPGGGQSDMWQTLSCRGKYAGEIRVEITYYDTRVHSGKPAAAKPRQSAVGDRDPASKQRTPVKRRPLPSDPITGEAPPPQALPVAIPPPAHQETYQTPPRSLQGPPSQSAFIPNQSPLQSLEYGTPPSAPRHHQQDLATPSPHSAVPHAHPVSMRSDSHYAAPHQRDAYDEPGRHYEDGARASPLHYEQPRNPRAHHGGLTEALDLSPRDDPRMLPALESGRPPPPPAHRSRHNSGAPEPVPMSSFDGSPTKPTPPMRHGVLRQEAQRRSTSAYPGQSTYQPYGPTPPAPNAARPHDEMFYEHGPQRHQSRDSALDAHHRSLQATVEDVPDSPTGTRGSSYRQPSARNSCHDELTFDDGSGYSRPGTRQSPAAHGRYGAHSPSYGTRYPELGGRAAINAPPAPRGHSLSPLDHSFPDPNEGGSQPHYRHGSEPPPQTYNFSHRAAPTLPSSLVPGIDPATSHEVSEHIREEQRRNSNYRTSAMATPPRGRPVAGRSSYGQEIGFQSPEYVPSPFERGSGSGYPAGPGSQPMHRQSFSPGARSDPEQAIRRKSVSPAPSPQEGRASSEIPFGPDSYNAFNPGMSPQPVAAHDDIPEPGSKIITHDGREVDPSDHLPMDTWAPEPEPKQEKLPSAERRSRPSPAGAQPMPPSGRRPLRVARPQTMPAPSAAPLYRLPDEPHTPPAAGSAGRNRLQKKTPRSPAGNSPLAPRSPDNYQDRQSPYTPSRAAARNSPWDYPSENHTPQSAQYGHGHPVQAKVPIPMMSGANQPPGEEALAEEMSRIDIGTGRSRRRGGY